MDGIKIVGLGKSLPDKVMTNDDFSKIVDTNDAWISTRTGIKERHFCETETNAFLASQAAKNAIEGAGINKEQICCVIVATFTPDQVTPSMACMVQKKLGLPESTACLDINAACSGFLYGLQLMRGMLLQEQEKRQYSKKEQREDGQNGEIYGLVIGSEVISRYIDMTDRGTCILFGDGAGAAVVRLDPAAPFYSVAGARGNYEVLHAEAEEDGRQFLRMNGQEVFRFAVGIIPECVDEILAQSGKTIEDIDYVVCHQANARIIDFVRKVYKVSQEKFFVDLDRLGNTSAASIPIALCEMKEQGLLKEGTKTICVGFGAGLTWAGVYLEF